jgi:hypothetical protein
MGELPELNISADELIETDGLPDEVISQVNSSRGAVVFIAAGKENLIEPEASELVAKLREQELIVGWQNLSSFPGPPYFEALATLIPPGVAVLNVFRDLMLAWLENRREREIEILIPGKVSLRLKGTDATVEKVQALISTLNETLKPKKTSTNRRRKAIVRSTPRKKRLLED